MCPPSPTKAIEFWNTVAEYELDLLEDGDVQECRNFIGSAAQYLTPILLESLTKQVGRQRKRGGPVLLLDDTHGLRMQRESSVRAAPPAWSARSNVQQQHAPKGTWSRGI